MVYDVEREARQSAVGTVGYEERLLVGSRFLVVSAEAYVCQGVTVATGLAVRAYGLRPFDHHGLAVSCVF